MGSMKELSIDLGQLSLRHILNEVNQRVSLIFEIDATGTSVFGKEDWEQMRAKIVHYKWGKDMHKEESNFLYLLNRQELTEVKGWFRGEGENRHWVGKAAHVEGEIDL